MVPLPIEPFRDKIAAAERLVLTAPTGSGKSTQAPQFLLGKANGRILVLEPRRLSARSLAARVASELKTPLGGRVGYQVRHDSKVSRETEIVFQTYGVFVQQLLHDPQLKGVGAVLLDEFHERTLEADLALAWLKKRAAPRVLVMSATLGAEDFLPGGQRLEVPGRLFPVDIRHRPGDVLPALQELAREGLDGSVLVFMPGLREIRRTLDALGPFCRERGLELRSLHGTMELDEQQRVLEPGKAPRVIVATNVAETGLTVPGVTAVIDSGLHRVAGYDAARGINTLYLSRISRSNADQRAGRAGRTAPGRCVRLWSKADEAGLAPSLPPEIARLELSALRLQAASLPQPVEWLTPPKEAAWKAAGETLRNLGALDDAGITETGRALLRYPVSPRLASVLEAARRVGPSAYDRACAMAAAFETESSGDLSTLEPPGDVYRQLKALGRDAAGDEAPGALAAAWLRAFADRLAAREGEGSFYRLADGRGALLPNAKDPPALILALEARERAGGGQARQATISLYLPVTLADVERAFPGEAKWTEASEFDSRKQRVVRERRLMWRGLALERKESSAKPDAAGVWAEKLASGELRHPGFDEKVEQLVTRVKLARRLYPDLGFPALDPDDWRLIYEELCEGKNSLKDIEREPLLPRVASYLGPLAQALDRLLPPAKKLPSGRSGRFLYHESRPAELSARLGDFLGMKGTLALCEGRLPVVFDILAPNYRTVQKTNDLTSFWTNTYPEVKKELKRRYPRHPWP